MRLLERLRSLARLTSVGLVPTEIIAALVNDLYSALRSLAIGAITGVLVGGIAASRTGSDWLNFLTVATACVALGRGLLTIEYYKRRSSIVGNGAALGRWERWYAVGALAYGACLGSMCFVGLVFTDDPFCQLLLTIHAVGFTAGTTARTSSRPWIAITQVSSILLPIALASALRGGLVYLALSAIIFLYYLATIEFARYLGANRLRLLLTTAELAEQNFRFDTALANMSHGLCMFDSKHRLMVWNRRFCEISKIPPEVLSPGITIRKLIELSAARGNYPDRSVNDLVSENVALLNSDVVTHSRRLLPDGRIIALSYQPMTGGGAVVIYEDVTDREKAEERAQFLATHDDLTGLPNRWMFAEAVDDAVKAGHRYGHLFAVMFMDLDRFKNINDTLGHAAGDVLLIETAKRLKECVRKSDAVARIGGDEFVILLREISDQSHVAAVAQKILTAVVKPLTIHGHECRITASIGISMFPTDALDEETLIKNADAAMYVVKEEGRNGFRFHFQDITNQSIERLTLEASLRSAVMLAIDDFGTGYSSMSLLKKFPIDVLKIDRSFVREITSHSEDKAIADAIIALGRALGLTIVAEGVETPEQENFLRAHHCDQVQGYLISKPVPADEFAAFMADRTLADLKTQVAKAAPRPEVRRIGTQG